MKKKILSLLMALVLAVPILQISASASVDPYNTIQASSFNDDISLHPKANFAVSPSQVSAIWKGDYLGYKDLDFGSIGPKSVSVTSGAREGFATMVELRIDKPDGQLIASVPITPVNFQTGITNTALITVPVTGVHDLYITYNTHTADLFNFCFFTEDPDKFVYSEYALNRAYSDLGNDNVGHEANLLWQLGILSGEEGSAFDEKLPVSRAEFADAIYGIYAKRNPGNITEEEVKGTATAFTDVSADEPYSKAVSYLSEIGVISGVSETEFKPEQYIKYVDAVTILVRMRGYTELAELRGGYPAYYLQIAAEQGISSGTAGTNEVLRRGDMAVLIYKALQAEYLEITGVSSPDYVLYESRKGVLEQTQKVYNQTGVIEATEISALTMPESGVQRNMVLINGELYNLGETNAISLLGIECEYFYEIESNGDKTLRAVAPAKKTEIIEISPKTDVISEISDSRIVYSPSGAGKEKTIKLQSDANVLYNGVAADAALAELIDFPNSFMGTVTVVTNNGGSQTVMIDEYEDYVIESISYVTNTITGQNSTGSFTLSDDDLTVIFDENNEEIVLKKLELGDVVTVYQSKNRKGHKLNRVYRSAASVSGTVTEVDGRDYYIDGSCHRLSNHCFDTIAVGAEESFVLNVYGDIVTVGSSESGEMTVGLFMNYASKTSGVSDNVKLKILTLAGKTEIFDLASTVSIDGLRLKTAQELVNGKSNWCGFANLTAETAIRYRLNTKGEVSLIDTPDPNTNDGSYTNRLTCLNTGDTQRYTYYRSSGLMAARSGNGPVSFYLPSDSTVFSFFGIDDRENNCDVGTAYELLSNTGYQPKGMFYSTTGEAKYHADLFVWDDSIEYLSYEGPFVVEKVTEKLGDDGELHKVIRGWFGGASADYILHENATTVAVATDSDETKAQKKQTFWKIINNLKTGDILRFEIKPKGTVRAGELWLLYDGSASRGIAGGETITPKLSKTTGTYGSSGSLENRFIFGEVVKKAEDYIAIAAAGGTEEVVNIATGSVAHVGVNAAGVRKVNGGLSAKNIEEGDTVFVYINEGKTDSIIIYADIDF